MHNYIKGFVLPLGLLLIVSCQTSRRSVPTGVLLRLSGEDSGKPNRKLTPSKPLRFELSVDEQFQYHRRDVWFEMRGDDGPLPPAYDDIFFPPGSHAHPRYAEDLSNQLELGPDRMGKRFLSIHGQEASGKMVAKTGRYHLRLCVNYKDRRGRTLATGKTSEIPIDIEF